MRAAFGAFEGGPLTYNLPYYKDYHPMESLRGLALCQELTALYHDRFGIVIDREFFGVHRRSRPALPRCWPSTCSKPCTRRRPGPVNLAWLRRTGAPSTGHPPRSGRWTSSPGDTSRRPDTPTSESPPCSTSTWLPSHRTASGNAIAARLRPNRKTSGATRLMGKTVVEARRIPDADENAASLHLLRAELAGTEPLPRDDARCARSSPG